MLQKLKHKLLLICILGTTAIITITTLIALNFSEKQLNSRNQLALENTLLNVVDHLQNQLISYSWLAQIESNNEIIVDISTNSTSFSFPGSYITGKQRQSLISFVYATAAKDYQWNNPIFSNHSTTSPLSFVVHQNSHDYLNTMISTTTNDTSYQVMLIQDMSRYNHQILMMRLFFISLIIMGNLTLGLFSLWFVSKAIRPIAINQKEQTDFVSAASHELRSPLAVIYTSAEALLEDERIPDKHFIHIIEQECSQLTRLVNDLLFLARTDSSNWHIIPRTCELDTLLLDVYDRFLATVRNHDHFLDLDLPDAQQPSLLIDPERITQVLSILINNALTYTPPSTHITLSLENLKTYVQIKVIDHGPGIPDAIKPFIFKRFYRGDSSRHDSEHYGLGLSIAFEIIKAHKGKINIADTPGGGTTFIILLPLPKPK